MKLRLLLPLAVFAILGGLFYVGLNRDPSLVPSPLIDKPAPDFSLPTVASDDKHISKADLLGQVYLLNVWASWCYACRLEHEVVTELASTHRVPVYGLNYNDKRDDAQRWLDQFGDPYLASLYDPDATVSIDFGVYGAPETFLIDRTGTIRYKYIGPLTPDVVNGEILPLVQRLRSSGS